MSDSQQGLSVASRITVSIELEENRDVTKTQTIRLLALTNTVQQHFLTRGNVLRYLKTNFVVHFGASFIHESNFEFLLSCIACLDANLVRSIFIGYLNENVSDLLKSVLVDRVLRHTFLDSLSFASCDLASQHIKTICTHYLDSHCLKSLNLRGVVLDSEGFIALGTFISANKSLDSIYLHVGPHSALPLELFAALFAKNFQITKAFIIRGLGLPTDSERDTRFCEKILRIQVRNRGVVWTKVRRLLFEVAIGLATMQLPLYIILSIVDAFPHVEEAHSQYRKVTELERIYASIRKIEKRRR